MKKAIKVSVLIFLAVQSFNTLYSQQTVIKTSIPYNGVKTIAVEQAIQGKFTFQTEFQKWNYFHSSSSSASMLGLTVVDRERVKVSGYRVEFMGRRFFKGAYRGWFAESGFYFGKHHFNIVHTTTTYNPWEVFLINLNKIVQEETKTYEHKNVRVAGAKIGAGFEKVFGMFDLEISGGLNINTINSAHVRPTLPFKPASPYLRVGLGIAF